MQFDTKVKLLLSDLCTDLEYERLKAELLRYHCERIEESDCQDGIAGEKPTRTSSIDFKSNSISWKWKIILQCFQEETSPENKCYITQSNCDLKAWRKHQHSRHWLWFVILAFVVIVFLSLKRSCPWTLRLGLWRASDSTTRALCDFLTSHLMRFFDLNGRLEQSVMHHVRIWQYLNSLSSRFWNVGCCGRLQDGCLLPYISNRRKKKQVWNRLLICLEPKLSPKRLVVSEYWLESDPKVWLSFRIVQRA